MMGLVNIRTIYIQLEQAGCGYLHLAGLPLAFREHIIVKLTLRFL